MKTMIQIPRNARILAECTDSTFTIGGEAPVPVSDDREAIRKLQEHAALVIKEPTAAREWPGLLIGVSLARDSVTVIVTLIQTAVAIDWRARLLAVTPADLAEMVGPADAASMLRFIGSPSFRHSAPPPDTLQHEECSAITASADDKRPCQRSEALWELLDDRNILARSSDFQVISRGMAKPVHGRDQAMREMTLLADRFAARSPLAILVRSYATAWVQRSLDSSDFVATICITDPKLRWAAWMISIRPDDIVTMFDEHAANHVFEILGRPSEWPAPANKERGEHEQ